MINIFVKVAGTLQRFGTPWGANDAVDKVEELRLLVKEALPATATSVSPVLALIERD